MPAVSVPLSDSHHININRIQPYGYKLIPFQLSTEQSVDAFSPELENQVFDYMATTKNCFISNANKRSSYQFYLCNQDAIPHVTTTYTKSQKAPHKHRATHNFILQQGQLYRQADATFGT